MSDRQAMVLHFIGAHNEKLGYAPTLQEIADYLGCGKISVWELVEALVDKQYLLKEPNVERGLHLTDEFGKPWLKARDFSPNLCITLSEIILARK